MYNRPQQGDTGEIVVGLHSLVDVRHPNVRHRQQDFVQLQLGVRIQAEFILKSVHRTMQGVLINHDKSGLRPALERIY